MAVFVLCWDYQIYTDTVHQCYTDYPFVCMCVFMCTPVFYRLDLAKSEWCLEANRGIPASEISIILTLAFFSLRADHGNSSVVHFGCCLLYNHSRSLLNTHTCAHGWTERKNEFTQTHTFTHPSHTNTTANMAVEARTPANRQTFGSTRTRGTLCSPALQLSQVSDDIVMIILERFKHCYTHTGSCGSDCT